MAVLERVKDQIRTFHDQMLLERLSGKMNDEQWARIQGFVHDIAKYEPPEVILRNYKLQLAPFTRVFDHTHAMLKTTISLVEAWTSLDEKKCDDFLAKSGALLMGDDEEDDLEKLGKFHGLFVHTFGVTGLPPELKVEVVKKQVEAHKAADTDMPKLPAGQMLAKARAEKRRLTALARLCHQEMHNFLDSYFGKTGDAAYEKKKRFGYDRRTLSGRARPEDKDAEEKKTDDKKEEKREETPPATGTA